jgi:carbon monoxide dehydrogenase subunit G
MLLEPETLQACLPGVEKIERLDERNYTIVLMQKIGPLKARVKIRATLTRVEAPLHLEIEGQREDTREADEAIHRARIDLQEIAGDAVEISYNLDADIPGTLAVLGEGIIQAKTKKAEAELARTLQQRFDNRAKKPGNQVPGK